MSILTSQAPCADRRCFTMKCWMDGRIVDVVVSPPAKDEKHLAKEGIRGRIYQRQGASLKTISGVVRQDADCKSYFVPKES